MEEKDNYIFKWRRNWELSIMIHFFGLIINLMIFSIYFNKTDNILYLFVFLISVFINLSSIIYSTFYGWNTIIYFDDKKVWQKVRGKKYEWYWNTMTDCKFYSVAPRSPLMVEIVTNDNIKKLTFSIDSRRYKAFLRICPNENFKEQFKNAYED